MLIRAGEVFFVKAGGACRQQQAAGIVSACFFFRLWDKVRYEQGRYAVEARFTTPQHDERFALLLTVLDLDTLRSMDLPDSYRQALTAQLIVDQHLREASFHARTIQGDALALCLRPIEPTNRSRDYYPQ